jgi:hypothetical protein
MLAVAGRLFRSAPPPRAFVLTAYSAFSLWVRRGVTPVPELTGLGEEQARTALAEQASPSAAPTAALQRDGAGGDVLETRPRAGSYVKRGAEIEVVISLGDAPVAVPDLAGKSLAAARLTLAAESLTSGDDSRGLLARGPAGTVVGQDPAPGREIPVGAPEVTARGARRSAGLGDARSRLAALRAGARGSKPKAFRFGRRHRALRGRRAGHHPAADAAARTPVAPERRRSPSSSPASGEEPGS